MFESWLLVCLSVSPDTCHEIRDTQGPYPTEQQCIERIVEMRQFVSASHLFELNIKHRCKIVSEENNDESTPPSTQEERIESPTGQILGTSI